MFANKFDLILHENNVGFFGRKIIFMCNGISLNQKMFWRKNFEDLSPIQLFVALGIQSINQLTYSSRTCSFCFFVAIIFIAQFSFTNEVAKISTLIRSHSVYEISLVLENDFFCVFFFQGTEVFTLLVKKLQLNRNSMLEAVLPVANTPYPQCYPKKDSKQSSMSV